MGGTSRIRARDSWLAIAALAGFLLIAVAIRPRSGHTARTQPPVEPRPLPSTSAPAGHEAGGAPSTSHLHLHLGWLFALLLDLGLVLGVLALVALVILLVPRFRRSARRPRRRTSVDNPAPDVPEPELAGQVSSTFDAALARLLRGEREAAIIACWLRLERLVEAGGFPRAESETSSELVRRLASVLSLSERPLAELAALYREARFSNHRMSEQALTDATRALSQLRAEVDLVLPGIGHG